MHCYPVFLSVVMVVKGDENSFEDQLRALASFVAPKVSDYEIILVANGAPPSLLARLKSLTEVDGIANLQIYELTKKVDQDTASWVGVESSLGDYTVVFDHELDNIHFIEDMLVEATSGFDVVFAKNLCLQPRSFSYQVADSAFSYLFKIFNGVNLSKEASKFRLLSKAVINFILQHPSPVIAYKFLPATGGFSKKNLTYSSELHDAPKKYLRDAIARGSKLAFSTTQFPMRLVTVLTLFGAGANLAYSLYVLFVMVVKDDISPGWASLSLQQSGMFFLLSLVLLILGEYILNMVKLTNEGPQYHVANEFTSAKITRREKLNLEGNEPEDRN